MKQKLSWTSLLPFIVFITLFLGSGIILEDFYAIPAPIPAVVGVMSALLLFKGNFKEKVAIFVEGCGNGNIITMCLIYLLAGAFTQLTSEIGALNSVVNLTLNILPSGWLYVGIFIISAIVATATGTSMGAIAALGGTTLGFAAQTDAQPAILAGSLLCGAMFGDNLSVVSDTTIAATQSMECSMADKMKENLKLAIPAAVCSIIVFYFLGQNIQIDGQGASINWVDFINVLPYALVILLAANGMHVFGALVLGILLTGGIGLYFNYFTLIAFTKNIYTGFANMNEIFILSLLIGGLGHMVNKEGGLKYLLTSVEKFINRRRAYGVVASLVSMIDIAVANNTVAIIISSPLVQKLRDTYQLNAKKLASFMDIYSCIFQGIIPYGAQVLLILSLNKDFSYFDLIQNVWYLLFLFIVTSVYLVFISKKSETQRA
ncbi:Na+/H+ antiporter NhaC family protein [Ornithobacterium rhinotracheale]|uniref:Na+/H+ antiporter NhaC family protein n=1 Tax=Ornithobacterium rhinotracheale TaxID=28251 RepID=A0A3R5UWS1_ORNRH|nr:Na+/H+ antiporter NhaC family protein [Ornithobacterium rhinotracheale]QAR30384.1 Na+/H+ antiporter NhaC family protein [Ornithobacterium rhinotracheale]